MSKSDERAYDIIGDVHGQADKLEALLRKLGYHESAGAWRHPERQAIFVGDFIDRGPAQVRSVNIARRLVHAGAALAVMGNHELNAIAWHTPDPRQRQDAPLFFGHYWLVGDIKLQSPLCACVDYSAGKGGPLVAYRFDGEAELSAGRFVWVP